VALDQSLLLTIGYPHPFCTLRAVPTGTQPAAAPGSPSAWAGPSVGWGRDDLYRIGAGFDPTPPETVWDYGLSMAQPRAFNYLDSATSCGLCDTFLFAPGTKAISNSIWYVNGGIFRVPYGVTDRTGVIIDGLPAYGATTAHFNPDSLSDNAGLPSISVGTSVDPATGDLVVDERSEFKHCAPQPSTFPATSTSCTSFTDTGVVLERRVRVTDEGMLVTFSDHWKSVDNQAHELDAMYEDSEHSENAITAGHEGLVNFTWTQDGFTSYGPDQKIALLEQAPLTMLVKTDATTPDAGDNMNPFGAVIYGTRPTDLTVFSVGRVGDQNGRWHPRYARTITAGGDVAISFAYVHDFTLDGVKARAAKAENLLVPATAEMPAPPAPPAGSTSDPAPAPAPQSAPITSAPKPVVCVVPKLRGKTLAGAKRALKRAHCALGKVSRKASKRVKPGRVLASRLKAGSRVRAGTRVRVTVARKL
jgi:PASTA domain